RVRVRGARRGPARRRARDPREEAVMRFRLLLALVVVAVLATACEVYHGKVYWSGKAPGYLLEKSCAPADVGLGAGAGPSVRILVMTEARAALPRAAIRLRSGSPGAILAYVSNQTAT